MLLDLGRRRLGLDGDGAAAHQGHDRRGAGFVLGNGVVVCDDEPVAAGQLGLRARVKGRGHGACFDNCAGKFCRQRGRHVPVGIHPFGSLWRRRCRTIKSSITKHGKNGLANRAIHPHYVSCNFLASIGIVDNGRRKDLERVISSRDCTVHRNGTGAGSMSRPRGNRERQNSDRNYRRHGQQAAPKPTHGYHLDLDRDGDEHASMSQQNTASKRRPDTS